MLRRRERLILLVDDWKDVVAELARLLRHAIEHDELYGKLIDRYIHRYRIKPGITGWAQVNGYRGETDRIEKMQRRVEHDLYYLCNWSLVLDMRIVAATVFKGFIHRNAY